MTEKQQMFHNRLTKVYRHTGKLARKQNIACYRIYDHDLPEFPLAVDIYEDVVHVAEYKRKHGMEDDEHEAWLAACRTTIAAVLEVPEANIYIKVRQRKAGRQGQYEKLGEERTEKIVSEQGLSFIINLTDYLDTGLFTDHRITRDMVRSQCANKKVLNLFCYTGSFSVYAAAGGAASVTSVDMSKTYLNWARRNMQYNKLYDPDIHQYIQDDVIAWLNGAASGSYDLIICDPPTFSNSKRMNDIFDVQRDHVPLLKQLLRLCTPGGRIYFSNNYRGFVLDRDAIPATEVKDITAATTPFDYKGKLHRQCFLLEK